MAEKQGAALVTGGAVRVGRVIAEALADAGYDIALHYHHSAKEAAETAEAICARGRKCTLFKADLGNSLEHKELMEKTFREFPECNLLVNNASIFERAEFMATDEDSFDRHLAINFKAPFFLTQYFAERTEKGQVINILDTYITKTTGAYFAYLLSKKSLAEFTRMAARALAPHIRVNGICPGTLLTSSTYPTQAGLEAAAKVLPLQRQPSLMDFTRALLFLITTPSITGECLFVDSGQQLL